MLCDMTAGWGSRFGDLNRPLFAGDPEVRMLGYSRQMPELNQQDAPRSSVSFSTKYALHGGT